MDYPQNERRGKPLSHSDRIHLAVSTLIHQHRIGLPIARRECLLVLTTAFLPNTADRMRRLTAGGRR